VDGADGVGPAGSLLVLPLGSPAPAGYTFVGSFQLDPIRGQGGAASAKSGKSGKSSSKSTKGGGNQRLAVDLYLRN
jgi:hypothetical protein